jgi:SDR family mycofactocin-dependent oxidoreductase
MPDLTGRVAVITGGARGQGRAHALALAGAGADIAVCDALADYASVRYPAATADDLDKTRDMVAELGRRCLALQADVTRVDDMVRFMASAFETFGRIDILVANAGIWSIGGPMWEIDEVQFDETFNIDVKGIWLTCKHAIPYMLPKRSGSIVLTSSVAAKRCFPNTGHYNAAKAAVLGINRTLANELAPHNIRVNALLPGTVNTDMIYFQEQYELFSPAEPTREAYLKVLESMTPLPGRFTEATDQAQAVLWLASDDSRMVTGTELIVDGGINVS